MLDYISTWTGLVLETATSRNELLNLLLDQELIDFSTKRGRTLTQKYGVKLKRAKFEAQSRTSEGQQLMRELHSEMMQVQQSAVKPDPTRDSVIQDLRFGMNRQEATIESQKAQIKSLQRALESTQDSLSN